jgi:hypothetical protein
VRGPVPSSSQSQRRLLGWLESADSAANVLRVVPTAKIVEQVGHGRQGPRRSPVNTGGRLRHNPSKRTTDSCPAVIAYGSSTCPAARTRAKTHNPRARSGLNATGRSGQPRNADTPHRAGAARSGPREDLRLTVGPPCHQSSDHPGPPRRRHRSRPGVIHPAPANHPPRHHRYGGFSPENWGASQPLRAAPVTGPSHHQDPQLLGLFCGLLV